MEMFRNTDDLVYKTVYLVDNKRATFLLESINYANNLFENCKSEFYYPDTGFNIQNIGSKKSGPVLPVQYINSNVLPFKIIDANKTQSLLLCLNDNFSEDYLRRFIGLAQNLTQKWPHHVILAFPDYRESENKEVVSFVKSEFSDKDFVDRIKVKSFKQDIRTLEED
jgi:hypothetical protein